MVKSMTGYGRAVETVNGREYTVELRSVNNRYLDCTVKLPRTLSFAEDAVKQAVKATISRGKVDVFISLRAEGAQDVQVTLNAPVVEGYLAAMRQMVDTYGVRDDISVSTLSQLPDVFTVEKPEVDEEALQADLMGVVDKALIQYDAMRSAEGKALENDLRGRGQTILELVSQVEAGSGQTVIDYRTRLENKLKEVLANTAIDESRILTEAAIFADKVAVDEATVRLRSHLDQMNHMLTVGGAIGRKLEIVSGGATSSFTLVHWGTMPEGINHLRIGEGILVAKDLQVDWGIHDMDYLRMDCMTLRAQIVEVKNKPTHPVGPIMVDCFCNRPTYEDRGIRRRAIAGIGRADVGIS